MGCAEGGENGAKGGRKGEKRGQLDSFVRSYLRLPSLLSCDALGFTHFWYELLDELTRLGSAASLVPTKLLGRVVVRDQLSLCLSSQIPNRLSSIDLSFQSTLTHLDTIFHHSIHPHSTTHLFHRKKSEALKLCHFWHNIKERRSVEPRISLPHSVVLSLEEKHTKPRPDHRTFFDDV